MSYTVHKVTEYNYMLLEDTNVMGYTATFVQLGSIMMSSQQIVVLIVKMVISVPVIVFIMNKL